MVLCFSLFLSPFRDSAGGVPRRLCAALKAISGFQLQEQRIKDKN